MSAEWPVGTKHSANFQIQRNENAILTSPFCGLLHQNSPRITSQMEQSFIPTGIKSHKRQKHCQRVIGREGRGVREHDKGEGREGGRRGEVKKREKKGRVKTRGGRRE